MNANRPAAALVAVLAILAACGSGTGATGSASPSVAEVPSPSPVESEGSVEPPTSAEPSPTLTSNGAILEVVADALQVRAEPGTDAGVTGSLARRAVVRVESGPVDVDGFTWYEVVDLSSQRGWAAAGDGTDPWLAPAAEDGDENVVLSFSYGCDVTGPIMYPATTVTEGGRVIRGYGQAGGMTVGQLSESGMAHIRENVLGSQYLQASGEYIAEPRPGAGDPPGHGACFYTFMLPTGADPIVVQAVSWFGDQEEAEFWQPSPQRKALTEIANNLIAIDEALGDDAWDEPPGRPYVAAGYVLWIGAGTGAVPEEAGSIDPSALGLGELDAFGAPAGSGRCAVVTLADAFEAVRVLNERAGENIALHGLAFLQFGTDDGWYTFTLLPRTPDGQPGCDAIGL